ncbi:MAG: 30S ribosomal protein S8 [Deltaproteobacteria bacterium]|nr:30S ribosomal protein S8 [Deltaproteobacteria bacterium]
MLTDPIADMLTRMRNAIMMHHEQVSIPYSRLKEAVLKVFKQEGYIRDISVVGEKQKKALVVALKYSAEGQAVITTIRKLSKPGRRIFSGYEDLKAFRQGLGLKIVTTSKGVLSDNEARKQKLGGEVLVEVW